MRIFLDVTWSLIKLCAIGGLLFLGSCVGVRTILQQAPTTLPEGFQSSSYEPLPKDRALALFEASVYGPFEPRSEINILNYEILSENELDGKATLHQWKIELGFPFGARTFDLVLLTPNAKPNAPLIILQNFCPNQAVMPFEGVRAPNNSSFCEGGGVMSSMMSYFFGRHIVTPPHGDIIDQGYALAALYPNMIIPDAAKMGQETLDVLYPDDASRPGALAVWAASFETVAKIMEAEIGERPVIAAGHSRFGKTALMAAAWSEHIDAVIAHQSGTLGASSLTDGKGEPLRSLVDAYPHWGSPQVERYADSPESLPVRPADLLAAIKPKPVLLGNARRDVWSDPFGAFTEAQIAFGSEMSATELSEFVPSDRYAYWLRPGTHGVVKEDWEAFLSFLNAHFGSDD